ncbi:unnamed protein product [Prorocentrum cordatum]|uniref:Uncharacterized protein n=1 Tax=Prorocentrum cordatum TaxID=2364126 RepID=A0ABN9TJW4_9DINO|nr:unnamed protein product [Polarella glacialis]
MAAKNLIPHRLSYGPAGSAASDQVRLAFGDITAPEFRKGRYEVCHYSRRSLGGCTGPLAVDQTLWFCYELHALLREERAATSRSSTSPRSARTLPWSLAPTSCSAGAGLRGRCAAPCPRTPAWSCRARGLTLRTWRPATGRPA